MLYKDEAGPPHLADAEVTNKSNRYKHTAADIPDSWVLIYIGLPARSPVAAPIKPQRGCVEYRLHILFLLDKGC